MENNVIEYKAHKPLYKTFSNGKFLFVALVFAFVFGFNIVQINDVIDSNGLQYSIFSIASSVDGQMRAEINRMGRSDLFGSIAIVLEVVSVIWLALGCWFAYAGAKKEKVQLIKVASISFMLFALCLVLSYVSLLVDIVIFYIVIAIATKNLLSYCNIERTKEIISSLNEGLIWVLVLILLIVAFYVFFSFKFTKMSISLFNVTRLKREEMIIPKIINVTMWIFAVLVLLNTRTLIALPFSILLALAYILFSFAIKSYPARYKETADYYHYHEENGFGATNMDL